MRRTVRFLLGGGCVFGVLASVAPGCGPSVQSIYEGNVRFEHCNRLDLDQKIAMSHREACWREWLRLYTYGQVRDRIEYARMRLLSLEQGDPSKPTLQLDVARKPEERSWYLSSPVSTSPTPAPSGSVAAPDAGVASTETKNQRPAERPALEQECGGRCRDAWSTCRARCDADAGRTTKACALCEPDYKKCMKRCFE